MKRLLSVVLSLVMVLSLSACGNKKTEENTDNTNKTATEENTDKPKTEGKKEEVSEPAKFRELPVIELSDDIMSETFSIDGKVFKLGETVAQDFAQSGYEISSKATEFKAGVEESVSVKIDSNDENKFILDVKAKEDTKDIMNEGLVVSAVYPIILNPETAPDIIIGGYNFKEFTSLEDVQAKFGGIGKIDDVGSGNRLYLITEGVHFSVKDYGESDDDLNITYLKK